MVYTYAYSHESLQPQIYFQNNIKKQSLHFGTLMIKYRYTNVFQSTPDNSKRCNCTVTLTKESNDNQTFIVGINNNTIRYERIATTCLCLQSIATSCAQH